MKKFLSILLSVAMLALVVTGCAQTPAAPDESGTAPAASEAASAAPSDEKVVLKLGNWPEATMTENIAMFEKWTETFKQTHPNVEVVPSYYFYAVDTFVPLAESGQCPTIFEPWYTETDKLVSGDFVADMTDYLAERGWDKAISPVIKEVISRDGRIYGMPRDAYALGLFLNLELYEEAGLMENGMPKYPKTWDELAKTAQIIKQKTGQGGFDLLANDNSGGWHFSVISWSFGATLTKKGDDGKFTSNLNSPEAIEAMEFVKSLKWTYDCLTADPLTENWGTAHASLGSGAAAMELGANDAVNQPTQVNGLPVDKLALVPIPAGPRGDQHMLSGGTPYMFSKAATPAELNAALDFLQVMGRSPEVTDETIAGMVADAETRVKNGVPVLSRFPVWVNQEFIDADAKVTADHQNSDPKFFSDYFAATQKLGVLRLEEPGDAQAMYAELTKVLQAVVTDKNANVKALMETANTNYQAVLDKINSK